MNADRFKEIGELSDAERYDLPYEAFREYIHACVRHDQSFKGSEERCKKVFDEFEISIKQCHKAREGLSGLIWWMTMEV